MPFEPSPLPAPPDSSRWEEKPPFPPVAPPKAACWEKWIGAAGAETERAATTE